MYRMGWKKTLIVVVSVVFTLAVVCTVLFFVLRDSDGDDSGKKKKKKADADGSYTISEMMGQLGGDELIVYYVDEESEYSDVECIYVFSQDTVCVYTKDIVREAFGTTRLGKIMSIPDSEVATTVDIAYRTAWKNLSTVIENNRKARKNFAGVQPEKLVPSFDNPVYHYRFLLYTDGKGNTKKEVVQLPKPWPLYTARDSDDDGFYTIDEDGNVSSSARHRRFGNDWEDNLEEVSEAFVLYESISGEWNDISYVGFKNKTGEILIAKNQSGQNLEVTTDEPGCGSSLVMEDPDNSDLMELTYSFVEEIDNPRHSWWALGLEDVKTVEKTLTMWCIATEYDSTRHAYETAIKEMRELYPDVKFHWEAFNNEDYKMEIKTAMQTGDIPDIFFTWPCNFLGDFVYANRVYCLDDIYPKYADSVPEKMFGNMTYDGSKYGIPLTMNVVGMFVNTDVLKSVGVDRIPVTYDELIACCDKLVAAGITPFGVAKNEMWCVQEYLEPIIEKYVGAETLDSIYWRGGSWDNKEVAEAIDLFREMLSKGYFGFDGELKYNDQIKDEFARGKYAFYMNGTWNCADLVHLYDTDAVEITEFPVINRGNAKLGQLIGGPSEALAVSNKSNNKEFAAEYAFELAKRICKYSYLDGCGLPSWKVDYDTEEINRLTKDAAGMVADSNRIVLFGDSAMQMEQIDCFYFATQKLINGEIDGKRFCEIMLDNDPYSYNNPNSYGGDNRDLNGLEVVIGDWWSDEYWDWPQNTYDEAFFDMLHQAEAEHNFTITRKDIGDWGDIYADEIALSIRNNRPVASIITLDPRWVGRLLSAGLMLDVSAVPTVNWSDDKWNRQVQQIMTVNGCTFGFAVGIEPRTGVFFNKNLLKRLNIDSDLPYDLQKEGKWNWDIFTEMCKSLTKDTDNDGVLDCFGVVGQDYIVAEAALQSNGTYVIIQDERGLLKVNANDPAVLQALQFVSDLHDYGYFAPQPDEKKWTWDWYKPAFYAGNVAMYIAEEWSGPQEIRHNCNFDFGFVEFPFGPALGKPVSIIRENVLFVPNCRKTEDIVDDIMYAYNWYTTVPEGYEDSEVRWKAPYEGGFGGRDLDETLYRMMFVDTPYMNPSPLLDGYAADFWARDLESGNKPSQVLNDYKDQWQGMCDDFNRNFR